MDPAGDQMLDCVVGLVLSGRELIFFTVACRGLCFWFVTLPVLITQGCFVYCWAVLTPYHSIPHFPPFPAGWAGGARKVGKGHSSDSWPQLTKGPDHKTLCSAIKLGGGLAGGHCSSTSIPKQNCWLQNVLHFWGLVLIWISVSCHLFLLEYNFI